ncbi:YbhB/YbcL family Raf kinase inhibitor-like protein [Ostreiculturibacter nitratireducens]|uniref:YbhB/YbcL family Raf kinase inhibitor-like protein n=1 Tax=Ostreiculturibacter nitratireducens TaxID=3075226 RepID=UPI0031B5AFF2
MIRVMDEGRGRGRYGVHYAKEVAMAMELRSPAFAEGDPVPRKFTCEGADISPPLEWSGVPDNAVALALTCEDPDAPVGLFRHWAIYDMPADQAGLAEGAAQSAGFPQARNDFRKVGYGGPCPPRGHGPHRYQFRLMALSGRLDLPDGSASCAEVAEKAQALAIATAELTALYER